MPKRVIIIGAGGHGQVVAEALLQMAASGVAVQPVGFLDDDSSRHSQTFLGLTVLGPLSHLSRVAHDVVVVAIGDNQRRCNIFTRLKQEGESFMTVCHPGATIAREVTLGAGSMVLAGVVVNTGSRIGENVILNTSSSVDHHSIVEPHAHIAPGVHLGGEVRVCEGALVGIGAVVIPRRTIGAWSIVGAGALVHSHVPDGLTVVGVPAKPFKSV
jgi:sugar O-acyltransferase (sialic acid O-acetyltransferase NeuD family)